MGTDFVATGTHEITQPTTRSSVGAEFRQPNNGSATTRVARRDQFRGLVGAPPSQTDFGAPYAKAEGFAKGIVTSRHVRRRSLYDDRRRWHRVPSDEGASRAVA